MEKLKQVPVVPFGHLTEVQKRAYLIADNKIAEQAGWDREMIAIELGELIDLLPTEGMDVSLTGFEAPEVDLLLPAGRRGYRSRVFIAGARSTGGLILIRRAG